MSKNTKKNNDELVKFELAVIAMSKIQGKNIDEFIAKHGYSLLDECAKLELARKKEIELAYQKTLKAQFEPFREEYEALQSFDEDIASEYLLQQGFKFNDGKLEKIEIPKSKNHDHELTGKKLYKSFKSSKRKHEVFDLAHKGKKPTEDDNLSGTDLINFYLFDCYFRDKLSDFTIDKGLEFVKKYRPAYRSPNHFSEVRNQVKANLGIELKINRKGL